nr:hypothetical protein [Streptomyces thermoviolaceus]
MGDLARDARAQLEKHAAVCAVCRRELRDLRETEAVLGEVPPEMFLDGPPDGGDLLLQRVLRRAREEWAAMRQRRSVRTGQRTAATAAEPEVIGAAELFRTSPASASAPWSPGCDRPVHRVPAPLRSPAAPDRSQAPSGRQAAEVLVAGVLPVLWREVNPALQDPALGDVVDVSGRFVVV